MCIYMYIYTHIHTYTWKLKVNTQSLSIHFKISLKQLKLFESDIRQFEPAYFPASLANSSDCSGRKEKVVQHAPIVGVWSACACGQTLRVHVLSSSPHKSHGLLDNNNI